MCSPNSDSHVEAKVAAGKHLPHSQDRKWEIPKLAGLMWEAVECPPTSDGRPAAIRPTLVSPFFFLLTPSDFSGYGQKLENCLRRESSKTMSSEFNFQEVLDSLRRVATHASQLVLFRGILMDPVITGMRELLRAIIDEGRLTAIGFERVAEAYALFFSRLAGTAREENEQPVGSPWQNHLMNLILDDENPFTLQAECTGIEGMGESLLRQVRQDLLRLQQLHDLDESMLLDLLCQYSSETEWIGWSRFSCTGKSNEHGETARVRFKRILHGSSSWPSALASLAEHCQVYGAGIFGKFRAFHWKRRGTVGVLQGIPRPDPVQLEDLVGCEEQKEWLVRNTSFFLSGHPANNVLVYGDRGTGKSSVIKALLHRFGDRGLRMIEVSRDDLCDLPEVMNLLRVRRERVIVFVDDLSFEEAETQYKTLKAVLEGSLEARPANVLIYATSNRRHLIREYFSDRNTSGDEIRHQDTLQEKVSLADRFGIQLIFAAPDQDHYLAIVQSMSKRRGITIPVQDLERQALQWAQFQNGRSGRTARQFMDFLSGETGSDSNKRRVLDAER